MQLLNTTQLGKLKLTEQLEKFKNAIEEGEIAPLDALAFSKYLEEMAKKLRPLAMESAISDYEKHGERDLKMNNVQFSIGEVGVKYDYSKSERWVILSNLEKSIATERKALESTLRTLKKPTDVIIDGGEVVTDYPPIKSSTTTLKVSLK